MMMLKSAFIIAIVAVAMIGVMIPTSYGGFPDKSTMDLNVWDFYNTDVLVWPDKDHYQLGETVYLEGMFSPDLESYLKNANKQVMITMTEYSDYSFSEQKIIDVNDDGTFSTSLQIPNSLKENDWGKVGISVFYCKYAMPPQCDITTLSNVAHGNSYEFFIGDSPFASDFTIKYRDESLLLGYDIELIDPTNLDQNFIFRIELPSGISLKSQYGSTLPVTNSGFGEYKLTITNWDIVKEYNYSRERPETEFREIKIVKNQVNYSEKINIELKIGWPNPDNPNYTFKIMDSNGKMVFSGDGELYGGGSYNRLSSANNDINFDTNNLPKIADTYKLEFFYEDKKDSTEFEILFFVKEFEISKITNELLSILSNDERHMKEYFGEDFFNERQAVILTNLENIDQRIKLEKTLFENQIVLFDQTVIDFEENVKFTNISTDEKIDILYDFRPIVIEIKESHQIKFEKVMDLLEKKKIQLEKEKIQLEIREKEIIEQKIVEEKARINAEIAQQEQEDRIFKEKEKIRGELEQNSSINPPVEFKEPTVDPEPTVEYTSEPVVEQVVNCGPGTESVNGICQVVQTEEKSSKGGGCLIATATYGSEMSSEVQQLRELRDNTLLNTKSGTQFMEYFNDVYYSFSPIIADYERENPVFRETVKLAITPLISSLSILNHVDMDSEESVLGYGISLIILNLGMYLGVPAVVIVGIRKRF